MSGLADIDGEMVASLAAVASLLGLDGHERHPFKREALKLGEQLIAEAIHGLTRKQAEFVVASAAEEAAHSEVETVEQRAAIALRCAKGTRDRMLRDPRYSEISKAIAQRALRMAREWHSPSGRPTSAANVELLIMNGARFQWVLRGLLTESIPFDCDRDEAALAITEFIASEHEAFSQAMRNTSAPSKEWGEGIPAFAEQWMHASFARLEIGHKLAAALCLTDVPDDVEVRAPWPAWSLIIPDGLLSADMAGSPHELARVWVEGTTANIYILRNGIVQRRLDKPAERDRSLLDNLIRGACLALSNPEKFRKERQHGVRPRSTSGSGRSGAPDLEQARFLLSAPVQIDLREHLSDVLSGRKGANRTVQFLVRGHWRNQAYGPKASLRRTQWIQPFWKGPEGARVLLRQHQV